MIISAACKAKVNNEENVFRVHRHGDFYEWMHMLHCQYDKNDVEQGFIAWDGVEERFVSRQEAAKIAYTWRQIEQPVTTLYSEDLW